ncbi:hypothetical protein K431DRAFT_89244 [Polychaeton citri CBS 116435]|uniref:Uncharacterized protein n=1 Tax=Polychaeton citri CBS 116435 TaxID=1314669 RepID=A0A9P4Q754_9PEZI|nr:hypothetical protein K431DRAFT_89244 [Polychaeton citri CBS 116435]
MIPDTSITLAERAAVASNAKAEQSRKTKEAKAKADADADADAENHFRRDGSSSVGPRIGIVIQVISAVSLDCNPEALRDLVYPPPRLRSLTSSPSPSCSPFSLLVSHLLLSGSPCRLPCSPPPAGEISDPKIPDPECPRSLSPEASGPTGTNSDPSQPKSLDA